MLDRDEIAAETEALRQQVRKLPDDQRQRFHHRFGKSVRDPDTYAVLNYLFIAGLHHFYLGKWFRGLVNLAVFGGGIALMVAGLTAPGFAVIGAITALELYALFRAQLIVLDHNNQLMRDLIEEIRPPA